MTANIYDQHQAAFAQVSAYVVAKNGERVAVLRRHLRTGAKFRTHRLTVADAFAVRVLIVGGFAFPGIVAAGPYIFSP